MLTQVAEDVLVHESEFCQSNAVVVTGPTGILLVDPGVHAAELDCLATDIAERGGPVVAGFATHPHWDHLLWIARFGSAPRCATARAAAFARERLAGGIDGKRFGIPDDVPLELLGAITGVEPDATELPWDGPTVRILEHDGHARGHAALFVDDRGVLLSGDMLSDVLVPMLDANAADPIGDYLAGLDLLESVASGVSVVVPGHGSVGGSDELRERIDRDRAYVHALRDGGEPSDPRVTAPAPGWEWVADVHNGQLARLAAR